MEREVEAQMAEIDVLPNRELNKMKPEIPVNGGMSGSPILGQKRPLTPDDPGPQTNGQKKSPIRKGLTMLQQIRLARQKAEEQKKKDEKEGEAAIQHIEAAKAIQVKIKSYASQKNIKIILISKYQ